MLENEILNRLRINAEKLNEPSKIFLPTSDVKNINEKIPDIIIQKDLKPLPVIDIEEPVKIPVENIEEIKNIDRVSQSNYQRYFFKAGTILKNFKVDFIGKCIYFNTLPTTKTEENIFNFNTGQETGTVKTLNINMELLSVKLNNASFDKISLPSGKILNIPFNRIFLSVENDTNTLQVDIELYIIQKEMDTNLSNDRFMIQHSFNYDNAVGLAGWKGINMIQYPIYKSLYNPSKAVISEINIHIRHYESRYQRIEDFKMNVINAISGDNLFIIEKEKGASGHIVNSFGKLFNSGQHTLDSVVDYGLLVAHFFMPFNVIFNQYNITYNLQASQCTLEYLEFTFIFSGRKNLL